MVITKATFIAQAAAEAIALAADTWSKIKVPHLPPSSRPFQRGLQSGRTDGFLISDQVSAAREIASGMRLATRTAHET